MFALSLRTRLAAGRMVGGQSAMLGSCSSGDMARVRNMTARRPCRRGVDA